MSGHDVYSILPPSDVPAQQKLARKAATQVDYASNLDIQSRAARHDNHVVVFVFLGFTVIYGI